jgi:hypothetical protein
LSTKFKIMKDISVAIKNLIDQLFIKTAVEEEKEERNTSISHLRKDEGKAKPVVVHPEGFNAISSNISYNTTVNSVAANDPASNIQSGNISTAIAFWENKEEEKKEEERKKVVVVNTHRRKLYMGKKISGGRGRGA